MSLDRDSDPDPPKPPATMPCAHCGRRAERFSNPNMPTGFELDCPFCRKTSAVHFEGGRFVAVKA